MKMGLQPWLPSVSSSFVKNPILVFVWTRRVHHSAVMLGRNMVYDVVGESVFVDVVSGGDEKSFIIFCKFFVGWLF
jgi:hypothetical protein